MKRYDSDERYIEGCGTLLAHYDYCFSPSESLLAKLRELEDPRKATAMQNIFVAEDGDTTEKVLAELDKLGFGPSTQSIAGRVASVMKFFGDEGLLKPGNKAVMFLQTETQPVATMMWREPGNGKTLADFSPEKLEAGTLIIVSRKDTLRFH